MLTKVFISSVIGGFEQMRAAAAGAVQDLGHAIIRAEDFGASAASPRIACLAGVRAADVVILLLGQRYGEVQDRDISPTHEEFREAKGRRAILAFIQSGVVREAQQDEFVREVQDWVEGVYTERFETAEELRSRVIQALHKHELSRSAGPPDSNEMLARAADILPVEDRGFRGGSASLAVALAGGPHQQVLRPSQIEDSGLEDELYRLALFGSQPVLTRSEGMRASIEAGVLHLRQETNSIAVSPDGSLSVQLGFGRSERHGLSVLIEEDVRETLRRALSWMSEALAQIDPQERLTHVAIAVRLIGADHLPWRTRREHEASPNSYTTSWRGHDAGPVHLTPPAFTRAALRTGRDEIAQDLLVLLRRQQQGSR